LVTNLNLVRRCYGKWLLTAIAGNGFFSPVYVNSNVGLNTVIARLVLRVGIAADAGNLVTACIADNILNALEGSVRYRVVGCKFKVRAVDLVDGKRVT